MRKRSVGLDICDLHVAESRELLEEGSHAVSKLVESVAAALHGHILPFILLEDAGGAGDLGDDTEGILLGVFHHLREAHGFVIVKVGVNIPEGAAEVAVLVVEEDEINDVISNFARVIHRDLPGVIEQLISELSDFLSVLENPGTPALISWSLNLSIGAIKALEDTHPDLLFVEVSLTHWLPRVLRNELGSFWVN